MADENEDWPETILCSGGTHQVCTDEHPRKPIPSAPTQAWELMRWFRHELSCETFGVNCQVVGDPRSFAKQIYEMKRVQGIDYAQQRAMMQGFFRDVRAGSVPREKRDLWKVFLARRQRYLVEAGVYTPTRDLPNEFNFVD